MEIKFRQAIFIDGEFHRWHYWGYPNPESQYFISPMSSILEFGRETKPSQQYTGLHDIHGMEIYAGDKIKVTCGCGHSEVLPVKRRDGYNGFYLEATYQHDWDNAQLELRWPNRVEVVGHIYEEGKWV